MWFDEAVFYQIYPLGLCGAERENDFGEVRHRLGKIEAEIPRLRELGITAVLFNPLFESVKHGYDTVDFFMVDRRLGTNGEFKALVEKLHAAGIRVVLDGVFNHVGRAFAPFQDVCKYRAGSKYCPWFELNFGGNSRYNDGFWYADWEGHAELVKLRLDCAEVQDYLLNAVRFWMDEFQIDGLRLDVAYLLPPWFFDLLRRAVSEKRPDFYLMGEVVHLTNFGGNVHAGRLNAITNYECAKGLMSAFNSRNLFEIEHSLTRLFGEFPWSLYRGKNLFSFVDNHDILRAATALKEKRNLRNLYTVLFTMPGEPCVYYGSEYGAEGDKSDLDYKLRPPIEEIDRGKDPALYAHIKALAHIRTASRALAYGSYRKATLRNTDFSFVRETEGEKVVVAVNIAETPCTMGADTGKGVDLLTGSEVDLGNLSLAPFSSMVCRKQ